MVKVTNDNKKLVNILRRVGEKKPNYSKYTLMFQRVICVHVFKLINDVENFFAKYCQSNDDTQAIVAIKGRKV